jgi:hypothetical protein
MILLYSEEVIMENRHYLLADVAKVLRKKAYQITYALTSRQVPEPQLRVANKRVFYADDVMQLARFFKVAPDWSVLGAPTEGQDLGQKPEGLTLRPPFEVMPVGETCCEVRDAEGEVFGWTGDRGKALVLAGLLEAAARG